MPRKAADVLVDLYQFSYFLANLSKARCYYTDYRRISSSEPNALFHRYVPSTMDDSNHHMASAGHTLDCLGVALQQPVGSSGRIEECRRCCRQDYCDGLPNSLPIG